MSNQEAQIAALSAAMSTMPGMGGPRPGVPVPARMAWARELVEKWGVSIDPDQATLEAVNMNPPEMGNHGPHQVRERQPLEPHQQELLVANAQDFVNTNMADLAQRIKAADTEEKRTALREELRSEIPAPIMAAMAAYEQADPETLNGELP